MGEVFLVFGEGLVEEGGVYGVVVWGLGGLGLFLL